MCGRQYHKVCIWGGLREGFEMEGRVRKRFVEAERKLN